MSSNLKYKGWYYFVPIYYNLLVGGGVQVATRWGGDLWLIKLLDWIHRLILGAETPITICATGRNKRWGGK